MDLFARVPEPLHQPRLNGRMSVLEALVQHKCTAPEIRIQRLQLAHNLLALRVADHANARERAHVRFARLNVEAEQLAVQHHICDDWMEI